MIVYNSFCCHDNGLSPSGKALDSDSSISGVRIPQAQLVPSHLLRGFFVKQEIPIEFFIEYTFGQVCTAAVRKVFIGGYNN